MGERMTDIRTTTYKALVLVFSNGKIVVPEHCIEQVTRQLKDAITMKDKFIWIQGERDMQLCAMNHLQMTYIHREG